MLVFILLPLDDVASRFDTLLHLDAHRSEHSFVVDILVIKLERRSYVYHDELRTSEHPLEKLLILERSRSVRECELLRYYISELGDRITLELLEITESLIRRDFT